MWDYCSVCEIQGRRGVRRNSYRYARSLERGGKSAPDDVVIVVTECVDVANPGSVEAVAGETWRVIKSAET